MKTVNGDIARRQSYRDLWHIYDHLKLVDELTETDDIRSHVRFALGIIKTSIEREEKHKRHDDLLKEGGH